MIDITLPLMQYRQDVAGAEARASMRRLVAERLHPTWAPHRERVALRRTVRFAWQRRRRVVAVWARPIGRPLAAAH